MNARALRCKGALTLVGRLADARGEDMKDEEKVGEKIPLMKW